MFDKRFIALCVHLVVTSFIINILCAEFCTFAAVYSVIAHFILYSLLAFLTLDLSKKCVCWEKVSPSNKAVLITGCDTGFGHILAKRLDSKGFEVFAACLYPDGKGAEELKRSCSNKLKVLYTDVRNVESIEKAVIFVKENLGNSEFWALVNNAGIFKGLSIELTSLDTFKEILDINTLGVVRMTKAFLPLLRRSKGRVVNITSHDSRITQKGICAYCMSKYAAGAFTECLRTEMKIWGVSVIAIEPDYFRTAINATYSEALDKEFTKINPEVLASYGEDFLKKYKRFAVNFMRWASPRTDIVVADMESAVTDMYPNLVYRPRRNFFFRALLYIEEKFPTPFVENCSNAVFDYILEYPAPRGAKRKAHHYKK